LHNALVAVASHIFTLLIGVGGLQALEGDLGEELGLGEILFGTENENFHILGGRLKYGDHTSWRGGT